ncbi:hypothetical protein SAMN05421788_102162 [Filimonas lacunae]|uniref:Helix-turn-helix n=1 Tax=Filimonas lacunae TaxID=477680 RepID=A0A173MIC0_9BACT|nr:helix-turn-helix transcriptional regulator [Filimonas lacunae]BAV07217.1 hypothetical protein FLA_3240 [Filimonas lacunae]SIS93118.1 hypothetical protein SAMN05421788_102162 [Filimonas lacunae]
MNAFDRLFIARTFLSLSQKEAAEQAGINAAAISVMERGEKKFIPTEYIHFLYEKGIDLNWIFSDSNDTSLVFRQPAETTTTPALPTTTPPPVANGSLHAALSSHHQQHTHSGGMIMNRYMQDFNNDLKDILLELKKLNASLCTTYPG